MQPLRVARRRQAGGVKGKHAVSAAARHAISERDSEIEMYRKNVARLTGENKKLRDRLDEKDRNHRAETRRLRAERDEGLSPQVAVLQREVVAAKDRAQAAEQRLAHLGRVYRAVMSNLAGVLHAAGFTVVEAHQIVMDCVANDDGLDEYIGGRPPVVADKVVKTNVAPRKRRPPSDYVNQHEARAEQDRVLAISRARGERL